MVAPHAPGQGKPRGLGASAPTEGRRCGLCPIAAVQEFVCRADCCIQGRALRTVDLCVIVSCQAQPTRASPKPMTALQRPVTAEQPNKALASQHNPSIAARQSYGRPCQPSRAQQLSPAQNSPASPTNQAAPLTRNHTPTAMSAYCPRTEGLRVLALEAALVTEGLAVSRALPAGAQALRSQEQYILHSDPLYLDTYYDTTCTKQDVQWK